MAQQDTRPRSPVGTQLGHAQAAGRGVYRTHMETGPWQGAPLPERTWEEWNAQRSQGPGAHSGAGMMTVVDSSKAETRLQPSGALHIPRAGATAAGWDGYRNHNATADVWGGETAATTATGPAQGRPRRPAPCGWAAIPHCP